jgi:acetylornithine deacetylase/succinyl-diaminopimelate desuccinylase-like protein
MSSTDAALSYARENEQEFLNDLISFLRIPSISTLPEHNADMQLAAEWVADQLRSFNFSEVQIIPTEGHPVVYGSWKTQNPDAPTILVYGHYDVQPVDPLDEWDSQPFEPEIRDGNLFARGASDMKGQVVAHIKATQSLLSTSTLPVNLKYFIEGEEEIGSPNLERFMRENASLLACDFCINADSGILDHDLPSLTYALRGLAYFEIHLQGPSSDLHSGTFGGAVDNPANVLCELIAGMKDEDGKITLPGFYDDVIPLTDDERHQIAKLPQTEEWWKVQCGAQNLRGEDGYTATERATARPTLDVNGLYSGFIGEGSKTVLPARAMAKISMRLVPDQTPEAVKQSLIAYLEEHAPSTVSWTILDLTSALPGRVDLDSAEVIAASKALEVVWGVPSLYKREGGTVPVVSLLKEVLGINSLMLGFGLPNDNLHAPNEKFNVRNFHRGIETYIRFMTEIANSEGD